MAAETLGIPQWGLNSTHRAMDGSGAEGLFSQMSALQITFTVLSVIVSLLALEQVIYRRKKGGLPGPKWTIPVIGKFADSLRPSLEKYQEGWNSGALSVASVFHIFIVIASSTDYTRKILNSPNFAEPCLVASAKKVLSPDNWYVVCLLQGFLEWQSACRLPQGTQLSFYKPCSWVRL